MGEVIKTKAGDIEILETWKDSDYHAFCKAVCVCGKIFVSRLYKIVSGNTNSCGCYLSKVASIQFYKHGHARYDKITKKNDPTREYSTWAGMHQKCNNPNKTHYKFYGGKGIKVCNEWSDFEVFLKDMGEKPKGFRLNRLDKYGDFEPDNCEWTPIKGKKK